METGLTGAVQISVECARREMAVTIVRLKGSPAADVEWIMLVPLDRLGLSELATASNSLGLGGNGLCTRLRTPTVATFQRASDLRRNVGPDKAGHDDLFAPSCLVLLYVGCSQDAGIDGPLRPVLPGREVKSNIRRCSWRLRIDPRPGYLFATSLPIEICDRTLDC